MLSHVATVTFAGIEGRPIDAEGQFASGLPAAMAAAPEGGGGL